MIVKFSFVAQSIMQFVAHLDGVAAEVVTQWKYGLEVSQGRVPD